MSRLSRAIPCEWWGDLDQITADQWESSGDALGDGADGVWVQAAWLWGPCRCGEGLIGPIDVIADIERVDPQPLKPFDDRVSGGDSTGSLGRPRPVLADVQRGLPVGAVVSTGADPHLNEPAVSTEQLVGVVRPGREAVSHA